MKFRPFDILSALSLLVCVAAALLYFFWSRPRPAQMQWSSSVSVNGSPWRTTTGTTTAVVPAGRESPELTALLIVVAFTCVLPATWLVRTILAYRRKRWSAAGRCPNCGYDLRASPERCPECGEAVEVLKGD